MKISAHNQSEEILLDNLFIRHRLFYPWKYMPSPKKSPASISSVWSVIATIWIMRKRVVSYGLVLWAYFSSSIIHSLLSIHEFCRNRIVEFRFRFDKRKYFFPSLEFLFFKDWNASFTLRISSLPYRNRLMSRMSKVAFLLSFVMSALSPVWIKFDIFYFSTLKSLQNCKISRMNFKIWKQAIEMWICV